MSKSNSISFFVLFICSFCSGYLAEKNITLPLIVDTSILIINFTFTKILLHDKQYDSQDISNSQNGVKIKVIKSNLRTLLPIFLVSSLFFMIARVNYSFYQPLFISNKIDIKYFGIVFSIMNLISSFSSFNYKYLTNIFNKGKLGIYFMSSILIISYLMIYCGNIFFIFFSIGIQQLIRGLVPTYFSIRTNALIPKNSKYRVTYISIKNFITTLLIALMLFLVSISNNFLNIKTTLVLFGSFSIVLIFIFSKFIFLKEEAKCYPEEH